MNDTAVETLPVSLPDYEAAARERLDDNAWAWLAGGAADEHTLRANREAWSDRKLWPRVLRPLAGGHTRTELLGRTLAHPVLLAPVAFQRLAHPMGELGTAIAAAAQGAGLVLSTQSSVPVEEVGRVLLGEPARGPWWFQLYLQRDRGATLALIERAVRAGTEALVLTVDAPVHGARDRERRAGFRLPAGVSAVHLDAVEGAYGALPAPTGSLCAGLVDHAATWADVEWLRARSPVPLLLKGVLHPADARQARALGVDGLVVSNHGGRTLDTAVTTAWALPRIADTLDGAMPLIVDGGIRRGTDVLKAIALGARAVMIGRSYVHGLAVAGPQGVAHVLRLLRDELEIALALTGTRTLAELTRDVLAGAPEGPE